MLICGLLAGLAGALDVLGWQFRIATNDIQVSQVGYYGIAIALLGRNTAFGTVAAALLFGALLNGTSVRNLDPAIFEPQLAGEPDVHHPGPDRAVRLGAGAGDDAVARAAAAKAARRRRAGGGARRMSTASDAPRGGPRRRRGRLAPARAAGARVARRVARLGRRGARRARVLRRAAAAAAAHARPVARARGWPGSALGVVALRGGAKRVGWGAVVACVAGALGAYGAVNSGEAQPRARRRLVGAARRDAALRDAADVRGAGRRDLRARRRRQHRPRGDDADRRVLRRLGRGHHLELGRRAS